MPQILVVKMRNRLTGEPIYIEHKLPEDNRMYEIRHFRYQEHKLKNG